ncbi:hypothetical protein RA267_27890, partial [Pseudomonas syringae pv. tagetis]|uniref:hypothetical protein n=1 Tax=Pseudomonas syringae group genomosp. 7 TaxID=251699 RepID=UPI0037700380
MGGFLGWGLVGGFVVGGVGVVVVLLVGLVVWLGVVGWGFVVVVGLGGFGVLVCCVELWVVFGAQVGGGRGVG